MCPNLIIVDSKEITPTERIKALQSLNDLMTELKAFIQEKKAKEQTMTSEEKEKQYTVESRRQMYKEMQAEQEKHEAEKKGNQAEKDAKKKQLSSMYNKEGEMRVCNEGRYDYSLKEWDDPEWSFFEMHIPQFLDTNQLTFELFPNFISVR